MMLAPIGGDYLEAFLAPLQPLLLSDDITDLFVNGDGGAWTERAGGAIDYHPIPELTERWLWQLARQMARASNQGISRTEPLLSATLPFGVRVQVIAPPATRDGFAMAFRRQVMPALSLADLDRGAMFATTATRETADADEALRLAHAAGDHARFLAAAVRRRKTILVSGGTGTGKTTFVNALLREIPAHERLVAIEDSVELELAQANSVGLIATRGATGEAEVTTDLLLQAALRLRPDRIVLGEIRGGEAATFLRAVNTGHPGSMTTIHADSPTRALDQLAMLALQSGLRMSQHDLRHYVDRLVDIVVQLDRTPSGRRVTHIRWNEVATPRDDG